MRKAPEMWSLGGILLLVSRGSDFYWRPEFHAL